MSIMFMRIQSRAGVLVRSLTIGMLLYPATGFAGTNADTIAVNVDQAKLVRSPARISTIVVGNPLIADVTMQPGGIIVVTGKGYGATNVIALDRTGEVLMDRIIQVEGPSDQVITMYKGTSRESYSCMPLCQRRVTLGDSDVYFKSTIEQAGNLNGAATGAAAEKN
jgi:Flp pilus assembly secretin CpaC